MDENRDLSFALELLQVDVDDTHWDVLDLTSSDTPRELLNALTSALMDTVSDYFSDGGMMQWIGSLVGLCSPRCNPDYLPVEDADTDVKRFTLSIVQEFVGKVMSNISVDTSAVNCICSLMYNIDASNCTPITNLSELPSASFQAKRANSGISPNGVKITFQGLPSMPKFVRLSPRGEGGSEFIRGVKLSGPRIAVLMMFPKTSIMYTHALLEVKPEEIPQSAQEV